MKIAYVAKSNIPSTSANSIHVMKISECFEELADSFELIVPEVQDKRRDQEIFNFYGIENRFPISRIKKKDWKGWYNYYFALGAVRRILKTKCDAVITRDPLVAFLCVVIFHIHTVLDLHGELAHICGRSYRMIKYDFFRRSKYLKFVMITDSLVKYYERKYALDPALVTVLPDGCTLKNFVPYADRPLLEEEVMKLAYAGSFGVGRGYEMIQELAEYDKKNKYTIYGGTSKDAEKITGKEQPENIEFRGFIANAEIPGELCRQDILLLPYQNTLIAKGEDTGKVMSPLKLFEYMASGRVIIASDLPVLREVVDESNCYFANPENVNDWVEKIKYISEHREEAKEKACKAAQDVKQYTWHQRAEKMLELVKG